MLKVLEGKKKAWSAFIDPVVKNKRTSFLIGKNS
jgi:hypothetical protein